MLHRKRFLSISLTVTVAVLWFTFIYMVSKPRLYFGLSACFYPTQCNKLVYWLGLQWSVPQLRTGCWPWMTTLSVFSIFSFLKKLIKHDIKSSAFPSATYDVTCKNYITSLLLICEFESFFFKTASANYRKVKAFARMFPYLRPGTQCLAYLCKGNCWLEPSSLWTGTNSFLNSCWKLFYFHNEKSCNRSK